MSESDPAVMTRLDPRLYAHPLVFLSGDRAWEPWTDEQVDAMRTYLSLGGMVVLDDRSGKASSEFALRAKAELSRAVGGRKFEVLPSEHAIFRSYYLLDRAWGRLDASAQLEAIVMDGRAAVIYSANDLLGAIARDEFGNYSQPVQPGGRHQRERARRFGVNVVLYALTLDYKEDLVHLPHILERRR